MCWNVQRGFRPEWVKMVCEQSHTLTNVVNDMPTKNIAKQTTGQSTLNFLSSKKLIPFSLIGGSVILASCGPAGPPASRDQIMRALVDKTRYEHIQVTGYMREYYGFHRRDGVFTESDRVWSNGYSRVYRSGTWTVSDGKVCYKLKDGNRCSNLYLTDKGVQFASGEIRKGDVGGTQRKNGIRPLDAVPLGKALADLGKAIGASPVGTVMRGMAKACQSMDCSADSAGNTPAKANAKTRTTKTAAAKETGGYRIFQTFTYGPGQDVVAKGKCNNGRSFSIRHYPNNGNGNRDYAIGSLFGSSSAGVAKKFCSL